MATSQAIVPVCTPAEAHAPSSHRPHTRAPQPFGSLLQKQETGDICIKQTFLPTGGGVCLNTAGPNPPLQSPVVNLVSTQDSGWQAFSSLTFRWLRKQMKGRPRM